MHGIVLSKASTWSMATKMMGSEELFVADLNLPDVLDPRETATSICRLAAQFPVVVFSDCDELAIRKQCADAGVIAFLKKSETSPAALRAAVGKAILKTTRYNMDSQVIKMTKAGIPEARANGV
jgi:DNA-binding NarL/FixJ family response regulator